MALLVYDVMLVDASVGASLLIVPVTVMAEPPDVNVMLPLIVTLPVKACEPMVVMLLLRAILLPVRLRLLPDVNDAALPSVMAPVVLVKLTVKLLTKLAADVPKPSDDPETAPPLSLIKIDASPAG